MLSCSAPQCAQRRSMQSLIASPHGIVPRARSEAKFRTRAGHGPVSILCTATGSLRLDGGATVRRTADADLVIVRRLGCSSLYACPMRRPSSVLLPCFGSRARVREEAKCVCVGPTSQ